MEPGDLWVPELRSIKESMRTKHLFIHQMFKEGLLCARQGAGCSGNTAARKETGSLPSGGLLSPRGGRHHSRSGPDKNKMVTEVWDQGLRAWTSSEGSMREGFPDTQTSRGPKQKEAETTHSEKSRSGEKKGGMKKKSKEDF